MKPGVSFDLGRCTGCLRCELACSLAQAGGYNPSLSKISISQGLTGEPLAAWFTDGCDTCVDGQCALSAGAPPCVKACLPSALKFSSYKPEHVFPANPCSPGVKSPAEKAPAMPRKTAARANAPRFSLSGYMGRVLRVDLSSRTAKAEELPVELYKLMLGGNGLAAWLLFKEVPAGADPFGPENKIVFATGPLNGTLVPMASKFCAAYKSPLTGGYMDSFSGSLFGVEMKYAGYDALILEGKSEKPVYVLIADDKVEFRDASHIWGKDSFTAQSLVKAETGDARVLAIGQAGENLVRYACVIGESRAFGTGGMGAVLGAKGCKALACRGTGTVMVSSPDAVSAFADKMYARISSSLPAEVLSAFGTPVHTMVLDAIGGLPVRNFTAGRLPGAEALSGELLRERFTRKTLACQGCCVPCAMLTEVASGPYAGTRTLGPEFQAITSIGSNLGCADMTSVLRADYLSDYYGVGQISAGNCIAWAMECFEKGILSLKDTGGLDLRFGNSAAAPEMMRRIALREGLGDLLAEGVKRAAMKVGGGAEEFACHIKGMEVSGFEPRSLRSQAAGFAVSNRGPIHNEVRPLSEFFAGADWNNMKEAGRLAKEMSDWTSVANSMVWCLSTERVLDIRISAIAAEMLDCVTGWGWGTGELTLLGERVQALERAFNVREGFGRKDDKLPRRMMSEPVGKWAAVSPEVMDTILDGYYVARGWDKNGIPTDGTMRRLGLGGLAFGGKD